MATRRSAGRTTVFAGSTLMLSMLVAFFIVPGSLLGSLAATLALVVALSVLVAVVAGPAVLTLLGPNVDRWRVGPATTGRSRLMTLVTAALRRPAPVAIAIGAIVLLLAVPALALKTGPPSQVQLSRDDPAREDFELIEREIGPGFDAPFVIVATTSFAGTEMLIVEAYCGPPGTWANCTVQFTGSPWSGSAAITCTSGLASRRRLPQPIRVPPVPRPATNTSTSPSGTWSRISRAVPQ